MSDVNYRVRVLIGGKKFHEFDSQAADWDEVWYQSALTTCETVIRKSYGRVARDLDWRMEIDDLAGKPMYTFSFKAERAPVSIAS